MALLRPSLTLVLDLDERLAREETLLEIKRSYAHIGTPVIRTHSADADAPVRNVARCLVGMGTYRYLCTADEGADERWRDIVEPWIANLLRRVGNNMKVFNDRQRKIKLPEVIFDRIDIELQGGELIVGLHPDPTSSVSAELHESVGLARDLLNAGVLASAARVNIPSDESYEAQRAKAWELWIVDHPEVLVEIEPDSTSTASEAASGLEGEAATAPESEKSREQRMQEDIEAKSYENTAVPPTDSSRLPAVEREVEEEEAEQFDFDVDYSVWEIVLPDGTKRVFDVSTYPVSE